MPFWVVLVSVEKQEDVADAFRVVWGGFFPREYKNISMHGLCTYTFHYIQSCKIFPWPILFLSLFHTSSIFFFEKKCERDGDGEEKHYMLSKFCSSFAWRVEDNLCKVGLEVMVVFMLIFGNRCWNFQPNNFVSFFIYNTANFSAFMDKDKNN